MNPLKTQLSKEKIFSDKNIVPTGGLGELAILLTKKTQKEAKKLLQQI
jgi:hypothetical protein